MNLTKISKYISPILIINEKLNQIPDHDNIILVYVIKYTIYLISALNNYYDNLEYKKLYNILKSNIVGIYLIYGINLRDNDLYFSNIRPSYYTFMINDYYSYYCVISNLELYKSTIFVKLFFQIMENFDTVINRNYS